MSDFKSIKYLVVDVDGTLTDSGIYYDDSGHEFKKFSTKDAAGFFAAKEAGIKTIILTGRESEATFRRMTELNVDYIFQNVKNKFDFLKAFMLDNNISKDEVGYIGDDVNDLAPMKLAGYVACPSDSCKEIIEIANYVSSINGGSGAFRDIVEHELRQNDKWCFLIDKIYSCGI